MTEPAGEQMARELRWVHGMIRDDLAALQELARAIDDGLPPEEAVTGVRGLETNGALWQLRASCFRHCHFVELHHRLESGYLFPELRRIEPSLAEVVERLDADHAVVARHLDEITAAADAVGDLDTPDRRDSLISAIGALAGDLLTHLAFEEERIGPVLRTLTRWPGFIR